MTHEERIEALIKAMTLEEKALMCSGADRWRTRRYDRLGIPALKMTDGPHGARTETDDPQPITMPATCFPTGSALAATWNTELMERVGVALGDETKAKGCNILLGPAVNIHRTPLGGRNFEYYSEDPHLAARMGVAWIKGLQSQGVGASLKHFACNNSEFERLTISSEVDERALHEIYYPAFRAAVIEAQPWTLMSSYNRINGVSSAHNKPMLTDLLKDDWGFTGFVVSDWGGVYDRVAAANAGCDVEMPNKGDLQYNELLAAVKQGLVAEKVIDDKVRRVLRIVARAGLFDGPGETVKGSTDTPARRRLAREAACEAMTLLKNDGNLLPLAEQSLTTVAVIGPMAAAPIIQGGGSAHVNPYYAVSVLDGIKERCHGKLKVAYEAGCSLDGALPALDITCTAEYFDNPSLKGEPVARRSEQTISLDNTTLPVPALADKDFSVRWTGTLNATETGAYRFSLSSVGISRLLVDGKTVVNRWAPDFPAAFASPMLLSVRSAKLSAGSHRITIEYSRDDESGMGISAGCASPSFDPIGRAVALAASSDVAIVCAGLPDRFESEGYDRPDMELTGDQVALIKRVAAANKRTVVVLTCGSPVTMTRWIGQVPAVLETWYAGQETGNALAAILFGDVNPSGKLPTTFPKRLTDTPSFINYPGAGDKVLYGEGIFVGYRYYDQVNLAPLFPFGHGLSYTTFAYGPLSVTPRRMGSDDTVTVSLAVANSGQRAGKEVVQLYVRDVECSIVRPPKELKAFKKVALKPGESTTVTFQLTVQDLSFYDPTKKAWTAEPGAFQALVGSSSRDIRSKATFTFKGLPQKPLLDADSRLSDILSDQRGRATLRKHLGDLRLNGRLRRVSGYTLSQLGRLSPESYPSGMLGKIEADLAKIK